MNTDISGVDTMLCAVCEDKITDKQTPVYADNCVYHITCESGVFQEVYSEL